MEWNLRQIVVRSSTYIVIVDSTSNSVREASNSGQIILLDTVKYIFLCSIVKLLLTWVV